MFLVGLKYIGGSIVNLDWHCLPPFVYRNHGS